MERPPKPRRRVALFGAWAFVSVVAGIAASNIPWGNPAALHGVGFPVAAVIWDKPPDKAVFIDYPNPLAYVINPLALFVAGLLLYAAFRLFRMAWQRAR
ncbi:MAG: hypothetical protein K8T20_16570 [Planctomycetes bacterium]|nr:hypothetical protein [Planctomycetota bacterium]